MGKIHDDHYDSGRDDWQTPPEVWKAVLSFVGESEFACDPCTTDRNVPAHLYYTKKENGLVQPWPTTGHIWVNPPFKKARDWVNKSHEHFKKNPDCVIWILLPADRSQNVYYHDNIYRASTLTFLFKGKLIFGMKGIFRSPASFPVQLSCYTKDPLTHAKQFEKEFPLRGTVLIHLDGNLPYPLPGFSAENAFR